MTKVKMKVQGETFYVSDWGYLRLKEGKEPTWIYLVNQQPAKAQAANPRAYWAGLYEQLKEDHIMRNCKTAYYYMQDDILKGDDNLVRFLALQLKVESDPQARGCAGALCAWQRTSNHDTAFAKRLLFQLTIIRNIGRMRSIPNRTKSHQIRWTIDGK